MPLCTKRFTPLVRAGLPFQKRKQLHHADDDSDDDDDDDDNDSGTLGAY